MKRANNQNNSVRSLVFAFSVLSVAAVCLWLVAGMNRTEAQSSGDKVDQSAAPAATFAGANFGSIPDGTATGGGAFGAARDITFNVTGISGNVSNVSVSFNASHTFIGDLDVVLKAPGGTPSHVVFSRTGATSATGFGSGGDLNPANLYTFNDTATTNWWSAATAATVPAGNYRTTAAGGAGQVNPAPVTNMNAAFTSVSNANGTWTLSFRDGASFDTGSVSAATLTVDGGVATKPCYDFYGTGRTSFATINNEGSVRVWRTRNNGGPGSEDFGYGLSTDGTTPGYFDNDNRADFNIRRGNSYFVRPSTGTPTSIVPVAFGLATDAAGREADYDGDGLTDPTVLRAAGGVIQWFILRSSNNTFMQTGFGSATLDIPINGADYTGDGRADLTVIRDNGAGVAETFFIGDAVTGATLLTQQWGEYDTDFIVVGDFIGDSRADFAAWRGFGTGLNGNWYIRENGGAGQQIITQFGIASATQAAGDRPVCGDFDGNGKSDIAVYRQSNKTFYWLTNPANGATNNAFTMTYPAGTATPTGDFAIGQLQTW